MKRSPPRLAEFFFYRRLRCRELQIYYSAAFAAADYKFFLPQLSPPPLTALQLLF
jgi:hypothetical protein